MPEKSVKQLAKQFHLNAQQLEELLKLLREEQSPAYILRYRKDLAGNLSYQNLEELLRDSRRQEETEKERRKVRSKLLEQGALTEDLEQKLTAAETISELIDYYVPFRPRKRSRSRLAVDQGLEPLARTVFKQEEPIPLMSEAAAKYVDAARGVASVGDALDGIFHIICDWIAEEKSHRDKQREVLLREGKVVARGAEKSIPGRLRSEFRDYLNFAEPIKQVHGHHALCLQHGKRLKVLNYEVHPPLDYMYRAAAELYLRGGAEQFNQVDVRFGAADAVPEKEALGELTGAEFLYFCIRYSLANVLAPVLTREVERQLRRDAEDRALEIIRRNLKTRLMMSPLGSVRTLGICPGYRTGCKLAALDEKGGVLETDTVHPHTPLMETEKGEARILELIQKHNLAVAVVGDGTGSQETEALLAKIITEKCPNLRYAVLTQAEAEAYAASPVAAKELPDLSEGVRASVSLARRALDPLVELTKINLRSLCSGEYVDDCDAAALKKTMHDVAQECVAEVGVDLNAAPLSLLRCVPGLNSVSAAELVKWREAHTRFETRDDLKQVPKVDENAWRQAAGFVRIEPAKNPLDGTRIHPDHCQLSTAILAQLQVTPEELRTEDGRGKVSKTRNAANYADLEKNFGAHYLVIKDVLDEMVNPWPDPRKGGIGIVLRTRPLSLQDLQPGQALLGTVRKVVDFGAFVDVGLGEDGLVHISELSDKFVQSPYDVVSEGDLVRVKVVEVDAEKRRIALTMRSEAARKPARKRTERPEREEGRRAPAARLTDAEVPKAEGARVRAPQSTVGRGSRRVQKLMETKGPRKAPEPAAAAPAKKEAEKPPEQKKHEPPQVAKASDIVGKIGFAAVEKRGKRSD